MAKQELNSLADFERFVSNTIKPWSREQRIALVAGMADRWLPVYESFSAFMTGPNAGAVKAEFSPQIRHKKAQMIFLVCAFCAFLCCIQLRKPALYARSNPSLIRLRHHLRS